MTENQLDLLIFVFELLAPCSSLLLRQVDAVMEANNDRAMSLISPGKMGFSRTWRSSEAQRSRGQRQQRPINNKETGKRRGEENVDLFAWSDLLIGRVQREECWQGWGSLELYRGP